MKVTIEEFAKMKGMKEGEARVALNFLAQHGFAKVAPQKGEGRGRPTNVFSLPVKGTLKLK